MSGGRVSSGHLLLLGGMMCDERLWLDPMARWTTHFRSVTVADLTLDASIGEMADRLLRVAPARFVLAGLSLGGIVAFECWRQAPDRISHLALMDTNPFAERPERQANRQPEIDTARSGGLRELMINGFKPAYLGSRCRNDSKILNCILGMAMDLGPDVFTRQSEALRDRDDSRRTLPTITVPTAIICGDEDTVCPLAYHQYMADHIPNARAHILPECGHLPPLEAPDILAEIVLTLSTRPA